MKSIKKITISLLLITAITVVISSCSNQNENGKSSNSPSSDTVVINAMQFTPAVLNVRSGDTITWINKDLVDHNVKDTVNNLFYSDTLKNGQSFTWVVTGSANYICTIHPTMAGKIELSKE